MNSKVNESEEDRENDHNENREKELWHRSQFESEHSVGDAGSHNNKSTRTRVPKAEASTCDVHVTCTRCRIETCFTNRRTSSRAAKRMFRQHECRRNFTKSQENEFSPAAGLLDELFRYSPKFRRVCVIRRLSLLPIRDYV